MTWATERPVTVLSVAGSDPSGGAGIQADLKTFAAFGTYGCAVLTALTAQSTRGVTGVHPVPGAFVVQQLDTLLDDVTVDAVKVGMLGDAEVAAAVFDRLERWRWDTPRGVVVLDPVMASTSGSRLLARDAVTVVRERGLAVADLVTPNLPETALLLDAPEAADASAMRTQAAACRDLGARAVLVKGGHLVDRAGTAVDVLADGAGIRDLTAPAVTTVNTHGTGCTLSSAIAASAATAIHAGQGVEDWRQHVERARHYLGDALRAGAPWRVGTGSGPVDHLVGWSTPVRRDTCAARAASGPPGG